MSKKHTTSIAEVKSENAATDDIDNFHAATGGRSANVVAFPAVPVRDLVANPVTCDEFLATLTRFTHPERGIVALAHNKDGGAWPARQWIPGVPHPSPSPYFTVSTVKSPGLPGVDFEAGTTVKIGRKSLDCVQTFVIVLDDVSSKVAAEGIPLAPTYRLESSPGNFQYGYQLATPAEGLDALPLINAIRKEKNADGSQKYSDLKGSAGVNRVMRVPGSVNVKPGKNNFKSVTREWAPDRLFTIEQITRAFGLTLEDTSVPAHILSADTDLWLESMRRLGIVLSSHPNSNGFYDIICCWFDNHGHDPRKEAAYKPGKDRGVYYCHHTGCDGRDLDDLTDYLLANDPVFVEELRAHLAAEKAERSKSVKDAFAAASGAELDDDYMPPSKPEVECNAADEIERLEAAIANRPAVKLYPLGKDNPERKLPSRQTANVLITRGEAAMLVAQGAGGKGALMLSMLMAMQTQRHDLFDPQSIGKFEGPVLLVSNEDTEDDLDRRRKGWLKFHELDKGALVGPQAYMVPPNFRAFVLDEKGRVAPTAELMVVLRDAKQKGASAVGLDTFLSVLGGGMEENDNSTMGAIGALMTHLSKRYNLCLFGLSHMPKGLDDEKARGNAASLRGGGALKDAIRNMLTLTKVPRNKISDPADWGFVYVLEGAKSNHGGPRTMYFRLHLVEVETYDPDDFERKQKVPVMVPYVMPARQAPDSDNSGLVVLDAILASEAEGYAGEHMRVQGRGEIKGAARIIAEGSEDMSEAEAAATIKAFSAKGFLQQVAGAKSKNRSTPPVWATTPEGQTWLAAKRAVFTAVDDDTADTSEAE